jgi:UDP-GlcNAc:undecaprenyl-phosphate GlcNAc-1-phosphate transferase
MPQHVMHLLSAFLLTLVLIHILQPIAGRLWLLDLPQGRKIHESAVPTVGGLAMFAAFILPAIHLDTQLQVYWDFLIGTSVFVLIGLIDDVLALGPWAKLGGQIAAALMMTLPGDHLIGTSTLLGTAAVELPQMKVALTTLFVVGVVNAFNMIDGLDGVAGGAAAAALLGLAIVAWITGMIGPLVHLLLLLSTVLGFLAFNLRHPWRERASVFMGDAGSMMLGGAVAFFAIVLAVEPERAAPLPALLWFFALPVFDTLILIVRRLAARRNPLRGDRRHIHHFLVDAGFSARMVAAMLIAVCLLLGVVGLVGWCSGVPDHLMLLGLLVPFMLHSFVVLNGWTVIERFRVTQSTDSGAAADNLSAAKSRLT